MPELSRRANSFTDSVIRRMTRISDAHGAINLSQGFPDFEPPQSMLDALAKAAYAGRTSIPLPLARRISGTPLPKSRAGPSAEPSIRIGRLW